MSFTIPKPDTYREELDAMTTKLMFLYDTDGPRAVRSAAAGIILAASIAYLASDGDASDLHEILKECIERKPQ